MTRVSLRSCTPAAFARLALLFLLAAPLWADGHAKVHIDAQDRNLREVVGELARQAGVEVRYQPGVAGVINARVDGVPFEQALTTVLTIAGYGWRRVEGAYLIGRFGPGSQQGDLAATVMLTNLSAVGLARSLGWLDLSQLANAGAPTDLRWLLPPGLAGPPRPTADGKGLEVHGTAAAVADFKQMAAELDKAPTRLGYQWLVARATPELLADLKVAWAQGVMNAGRSPGRQVMYSSSEFESLYQRLAAAPAGLTVLAKGRVGAGDLEVVTVAADPNLKLTLAGRLESALSLRLWLAATVTVDGASVEMAVDGGLLPPEEGCLLVSKPLDAAAAPGPLVLLLIPTVSVAP
jgi:hypothetical protein